MYNIQYYLYICPSETIYFCMFKIIVINILYPYKYFLMQIFIFKTSFY